MMKILLLSPKQGEIVSLLPRGHQVMLSGGISIQADNELDWENLKRKGTENSFPLPVRFAWHSEGDGTEEKAWKLLLSTRSDFSAPRVIDCPAGSREADIYNLRSAQQYFWKIQVIGSEGIEESPVGSFCTLDETPTLYRVEGLTNIRDIGGWHTADGRRVRRDMIFRGSEMDTHHQLTEDGRQSLRADLGIRTDLDLRGEAVGKVSQSPIGEDIRFELLPVKAYAEFMAEEQADACRAVFSLFADETAYPIYLHCWGGADRAGTVVLLLNALLGVENEPLLLDYEMTMFSVWGERSRNSELFQGLMAALDQYGSPEEPIRTKAEKYLRTIGVTDAQIASIRRLLLV